MITLETNYAGLKLKNPIIISSSNLTNTPEKNQKLCAAGAGAIVLKSLFEEQINMEANSISHSDAFNNENSYLIEYIKGHKLVEYLNLIKESKAKCNIPIIASINCYDNNNWVGFAKKIAEAGADAIEINILAIQTELNYHYGDFEKKHIEVLCAVKKEINIPVIMKLGDNLTNPITLINQLYANGAAAVVLFNRFYQPNINIQSLTHTSGEVLSSRQDLSNTLRWVGIASAAVEKIDISASGGIHSAEDAIKVLLAGSTVIEICSTIYKNGMEIIQQISDGIQAWMIEKHYESLNQFRGLLNVKNLKGINTFERTQFLKYFGSAD